MTKSLILLLLLTLTSVSAQRGVFLESPFSYHNVNFNWNKVTTIAVMPIISVKNQYSNIITTDAQLDICNDAIINSTDYAFSNKTIFKISEVNSKLNHTKLLNKWHETLQYKYTYGHFKSKEDLQLLGDSLNIDVIVCGTIQTNIYQYTNYTDTDLNIQSYHTQPNQNDIKIIYTFVSTSTGDVIWQMGFKLREIENENYQDPLTMEQTIENAMNMITEQMASLVNWEQFYSEELPINKNRFQLK